MRPPGVPTPRIIGRPQVCLPCAPAGTAPASPTKSSAARTVRRVRSLMFGNPPSGLSGLAQKAEKLGLPAERSRAPPYPSEQACAGESSICRRGDYEPPADVFAEAIDTAGDEDVARAIRAAKSCAEMRTVTRV